MIKKILLQLFILIVFPIFCLAAENNIIVQKVPFTSQAPLAEWTDDRQQDGCEEASALMAVSWAKNKTISSKKEAKKIILDISNFEKKMWGVYNDTSASATAERILKGYFKFTKYQVKYNVNADILISDLKKGNIIIAPVDGKALKNPNFSNGGPDRHMLVIIGYDFNKNEFITNDPGTRNGKSYCYKKDLFIKALRDYPTGKKLKIKKTEKNIIVIKKDG